MLFCRSKCQKNHNNKSELWKYDHIFITISLQCIIAISKSTEETTEKKHSQIRTVCSQLYVSCSNRWSAEQNKPTLKRIADNKLQFTVLKLKMLVGKVQPARPTIDIKLLFPTIVQWIYIYTSVKSVRFPLVFRLGKLQLQCKTSTVRFKQTVYGWSRTQYEKAEKGKLTIDKKNDTQHTTNR